MVRPSNLPIQRGWFNAYYIGFGATRLLMPGFESFGYVSVMQFLQVIAPLYVSHLGESLLGDGPNVDEVSIVGSEDKAVNQHSAWWMEGVDLEPLMSHLGNPMPSDYE